ncbi:hypothetical protein GCM10011428_47230 [Streptomyces violaceus]
MHDRLVEHQVRADLRVREPDAAMEAAARQMQIALRLHPGRLEPRHRAVHHPYGREAGLRQQHVLLEPALSHLDVRHHRAPREIQRAADAYAGQLQRRHPAGQGGRAVEEQPADDPGPHGPLLAPRPAAVRIVHQRVTAAQVVHAAVAEGLPHAGLDRGQVFGHIPGTHAGPLGPTSLVPFLPGYSRVGFFVQLFMPAG